MTDFDVIYWIGPNAKKRREILRDIQNTLKYSSLLKKRLTFRGNKTVSYSRAVAGYTWQLKILSCKVHTSIKVIPRSAQLRIHGKNIYHSVSSRQCQS